MKALTVFQPWASLIMLEAKPYEFRKDSYLTYTSRPAPGDRIVIHASARPIRSAEVEDLVHRILQKQSSLDPKKALPLLDRILKAYKCRGIVELSAALGTAVIGGPRLITDVFRGKAIADSDRFDHCRWAWPMTEIKPFREPMPQRRKSRTSFANCRQRSRSWSTFSRNTSCC